LQAGLRAYLAKPTCVGILDRRKERTSRLPDHEQALALHHRLTQRNHDCYFVISYPPLHHHVPLYRSGVFAGGQPPVFQKSQWSVLCDA